MDERCVAENRRSARPASRCLDAWARSKPVAREEVLPKFGIVCRASRLEEGGVEATSAEALSVAQERQATMC